MGGDDVFEGEEDRMRREGEEVGVGEELGEEGVRGGVVEGWGGGKGS